MTVPVRLSEKLGQEKILAAEAIMDCAYEGAAKFEKNCSLPHR